jgi:hypothetical protein
VNDHEVVATCLWRITPELLIALDDRFGDPIDAYVNGSQVWIREDGPAGEILEWRLHPVRGYTRPKGMATEEVLEQVVFALRTGEEPAVPLAALWDGLEAFPCDGDEVEPAPLAASVTTALGLAPDAFGMVDHTVIADRWEATLGADVSVVELLFEQLA